MKNYFAVAFLKILFLMQSYLTLL